MEYLDCDTDFSNLNGVYIPMDCDITLFVFENRIFVKEEINLSVNIPNILIKTRNLDLPLIRTNNPFLADLRTQNQLILVNLNLKTRKIDISFEALTRNNPDLNFPRSLVNLLK